MLFTFGNCFSILISGLIIKQMLTRAAESNCEAEKELVKNTKGVIFYSTPHSGTQVAKLNATSRYSDSCLMYSLVNVISRLM